MTKDSLMTRGSRSVFAEYLAWAAVLFSLIASGGGVLASDKLYTGTPDLLQTTFANDVFTLCVAVPLLALSLILIGRRPNVARLLAIGTLGCIAYLYGNAAVGLALNAMTLVHVGVVMLAWWALLLLVRGLDVARVEHAMNKRVLRKPTGGFFFFMALVTLLHWVGAVASQISTGNLPPDVTKYGWVNNPLITIDLVFVLPLWLVVGYRMLRSDHDGTRFAIPLLVFSALLDFGLLLTPVITALRGQAFDGGMFVFGLMFFVLPAALLLPVFVPRLRGARTESTPALSR